MLHYSIENGILRIYFENTSHDIIVTLFQIILSSQRAGMYCVEIEGLEGTIATFIETCSSNDYKIYKKGKRNLFVSNLPTLFLVGKEWEDIRCFVDFIGSFNEGRMSLYCLDTCHIDLAKDLVSVNDQIWCHTYTKLNIFQDGDGVELSAGPLGCSFNKIMMWLTETNN